MLVPSPEEEGEGKENLFEREEFQMKFYSEKLNTMFDTQEACAQAESEHDK